MKKLIFLDIDGVLNNKDFQNKWMSALKKEQPYLTRNQITVQFQRRFIDVSDCSFFNGYIVPENLENFNSIIEATSADIILSSDWRFINDGNFNNVADIDIIKQLFKVRGIKGNIIGTTPFVSIYGERAIEILRCINTNNLNEYNKILILDDIGDVETIVDDLKEKGFDTKFIWTDWAYGLTKEEAKGAIEFLNKGE